MKFIIYLMALALLIPVSAKTIFDLRDELDAAEGVEFAAIQMDPDTPEQPAIKTIAPYPDWGIAQISYLQIKGNAITDNTVAVMINTKTGEAFWSSREPTPITEKPAPADPLGTDKEILTAVGGNIVKAEITRHPIVGDVPPSATVYGYREVDGTPVEFKVVVYSKGGVLVSNEPTEKAATVEAVK